MEEGGSWVERYNFEKKRRLTHYHHSLLSRHRSNFLLARASRSRVPNYLPFRRNHLSKVSSQLFRPVKVSISLTFHDRRCLNWSESIDFAEEEFRRDTQVSSQKEREPAKFS
jgi:hypothetical protein